MAIRKEKIQFFEEHLADFFRKAGREQLPWRKKGVTAYEVWVSEIMLQQTQVVRVMIYYINFLKRFPKVEDLAKVSWAEFLPYYEGLGYYARGRNMLRSAQIIVTEYGGKFPRDRKLLETLPGVGPYTAAAIMSFAYGDNHLAWDTNLKRVIGRFFLGSKFLVTDNAWWEDKFTTPKQTMNAALMDFGSALCVARPKCEACSLRSRCLYYREMGRGEIQEKESTTKEKKEKTGDWKSARVLVFLHENHKKYFSSTKKHFRPFLLPAGYNSRADIKRYFLEKYGLTLAVRPPHQKLLVAGKPTLVVNAQILLGEPPFGVFSKNDIQEYNRSIVKNINH